MLKKKFKKLQSSFLINGAAIEVLQPPKSYILSPKLYRFKKLTHIYTGIDLLLTHILRIDEEEFYLQNLSSDKPILRLLSSCKFI